MTIQIMLAILLFLSAILLYLFFSKSSSIGKYRKNFGVGMLLNVACNLIYLCFLFRPVEKTAHLAYGVYESLLVCSLFCLLWFFAKYFDIGKKTQIILHFLGIFVCADIVLVLKNSAFEQNVVYKHLLTESGEILITLGEKWAFRFHEILCIILAFLGVLLIALVSIKSRGYIRKRNAVLFTILAVSLISEWFVLKTDYPFDMGSTVLGTSFIIVFLFTFIYEPKALLKETLRQVSISMNEYLFVFDKENRCVFTSDSAKHHVLKEHDIDSVENGMKEWLSSPKSLERDIVVNNYSILIDNTLRYFRVSIHIFGSNNQPTFDSGYLGCFAILLDQTKEKLLHDELQYRATHDSLTGLYNFDYFSEKASAYLLKHTAVQHVMLEFDIKEFKLVSDQFDDSVADSVLLHIADVIRRQYDKRGVYCRQGKDQFYVLLAEKSFSMEHLHDVIQQMQCFRFPNEYYHLHMYAGVYRIESSNKSIRNICDCCYRAICRIKGGYESIQFYNDQMRENAIQDQFVSSRLLEAIQQKNIEIHLQVQVDKNGRALGAEALARWYDPQRGYITPQQFIPVLERNGLIHKLDQYVWDLSCQIIKKWSDMGDTNLYIAVNVSPVDIHYLDVFEELINDVHKYEISPKQLRVEITESAVAEAPDKLLSLIHKLKKAGFIVEMDDFGNGYSSLSMLKDIPVDMVKLDMRFLESIHNSSKGKVIVETMLQLCTALHIPMIAEGVETSEQAELLIKNGCQAMQGYLYSKPIPVEEFEHKFIQR